MENNENAALVRINTMAPALTEEKLALLKDTICKGGTNEEFEMFVHICNRLGLDPFARQIFAVKRWDSTLRREVMTAQVSIDGMRLAAQRTGEYEGQTRVQWCGEDGAWRDVWLSKDYPAAAKVGVYRRNHRKPTYAIARWGSYVQTKKDGNVTAMWHKMPDLMLAKCAESLALRKAFPTELAGLYSPDEMAQAQPEESGAHTHSAQAAFDAGPAANNTRLPAHRMPRAKRARAAVASAPVAVPIATPDDELEARLRDSVAQAQQDNEFKTAEETDYYEQPRTLAAAQDAMDMAETEEQLRTTADMVMNLTEAEIAIAKQTYKQNLNRIRQTQSKARIEEVQARGAAARANMRAKLEGDVPA